jgi:hypothetical protein
MGTLSFDREEYQKAFSFLVGVGFEISVEFRRKQASEFIVLFIHA